ncbi:ankyrin [Dendrothele bispora CBS 962.96]|uniref:Ankyrin n=1 Tax=Dendrothele bispora (strain CBS 962.96) TaxID=1314807 RepID=A0A4S8LYG9_DENBC|nr:ankyrin [Dendrothele bispora CBS 962.96]
MYYTHSEEQIAVQVSKSFQETKSCEEAEERVKTWLSDPNITQRHLLTMFDRAAHYGYAPIVELLIERGVISDINGFEAIGAMRHTIYYAGSLPVVQTLVKAGFNVNNNMSHDGTPLRLAVNRNRVDIVDWLLDNGAVTLGYAPDDPVYPYSLLILTEAAERASPEVISMLVGERGKVPVKHSRALERAAYAGRVDNVVKLLELGAEIDEIADLEKSPHFGYEEAEQGFGNALHVAAEEGHLEVVRLLLNRGADPELKDTNGRSAKERARKAGHRQVAALLPPADEESRVNKALSDVSRTEDYGRVRWRVRTVRMLTGYQYIDCAVKILKGFFGVLVGVLISLNLGGSVNFRALMSYPIEFQ